MKSTTRASTVAPPKPITAPKALKAVKATKPKATLSRKSKSSAAATATATKNKIKRQSSAPSPLATPMRTNPTASTRKPKIKRPSSAVSSSMTTMRAKPTAANRKPNGIKGITKESKANDPLRDAVLETLHKSGLCKQAECRVVFAHPGIYVSGKLFGWIGKTTVLLPAKNAAQRAVAGAAGCEMTMEGSHKYWPVPLEVLRSPKALATLAVKYVDAAK